MRFLRIFSIRFYKCTLKHNLLVLISFLARILVFLGTVISIPICSVTVGNCTLPVGSQNIYLHCNTSSSEFYWDQPDQGLNGYILIPTISSISYGTFICRDSHFDMQNSAKLNLHTSGNIILMLLFIGN